MTQSILKFLLVVITGLSLVLGSCASKKQPESDLSTGGMTSGGGGWARDYSETLYTCSVQVTVASTNDDSKLNKAVIYRTWIGAAKDRALLHIALGSKPSVASDRLYIDKLATNGESVGVRYEVGPDADGTISFMPAPDQGLRGTMIWTREGHHAKTTAILNCKKTPPQVDESAKKLPKMISCYGSDSTFVATYSGEFRYNAVLKMSGSTFNFTGMPANGSFRNTDPLNIDVSKPYIVLTGNSDPEGYLASFSSWKSSNRSQLILFPTNSQTPKILAMSCGREF